MIRFTYILLASLLASCAQGTSTGSQQSQPPAVPAESALIVYGFAANGFGFGSCKIGIGKTDPGKIDQYLDAGWSSTSDDPYYGIQRLPAGKWTIYQFRCGDILLDRLIGPRGFTATSGTFQPLAVFSFSSGSPVYIGEAHLNVQSLFAGTSYISDRARAADKLRERAPELVSKMRTTPIVEAPPE